MNTSVNIQDNINVKINQKMNSSKKSDSKEIDNIYENELNNANNVDSKCEPVISLMMNSTETTKDSENELMQNHELIIVDNVEIDMDDIDSESGGIILTSNNDETMIKDNSVESNLNSSEETNKENGNSISLSLSTLRKYKKNIKKIEKNVLFSEEAQMKYSNDINIKYCDIESDNSSETSEVGEKMDDVLMKLKKTNEHKFPYLYKHLVKEKMCYEDFDKYCKHKVIETIAEKCVTAKDRKEILLIKKRELYWKNKFMFLARHAKELNAVLKDLLGELETIKNVKPHIVQRTVGLQAVRTPYKKSQFSSKTSSSSLDLPKKKVPPTLFFNSVLNPVDLTDDANDVSNNLDFEKSINESTVNTVVPSRNLKVPKKILPKNVTYIQIPNNISSSSSYTAQTTPSIATNLATTQMTNSNSNAKVPKTTVKPFLLKDGKLIQVQIGPGQLKSSVPSFTASLQPVQPVQTILPVPPAIPLYKHPAPLPDNPQQLSIATWKKLPPAPQLKLDVTSETGNKRELIISWNVAMNKAIANIKTFEIFAYQESLSEIPRKELWNKIGEVDALPLPMACSLNKLIPGEKYHFTVRAVDMYARLGPFSSPHCVYFPKY